ncbi:MAG: hypothetical protein JSV86_13370 [Gemmatimonadota bacterium]|nr:MAG: hypothetical protein JSV86_13370 [Gemmatimonadota bacterium]
MRRASRVLLVLPLVVAAGYLVGFPATTDEPLTSAQGGGVLGCVHYWDSTVECVGFESPKVDWLPWGQVSSLAVVLITAPGDTHRMQLYPADSVRAGIPVDAVFLTRTSASRILVPFVMDYDPVSAVQIADTVAKLDTLRHEVRYWIKPEEWR